MDSHYVRRNSITQPRALVYAGPATDAENAMSVAHLLRTSPSKFTVTYVGGNVSDFEDGAVMVPKITKKVLEEVDLFAVPGGPGMSRLPCGPISSIYSP